MNRNTSLRLRAALGRTGVVAAVRVGWQWKPGFYNELSEHGDRQVGAQWLCFGVWVYW